MDLSVRIDDREVIALLNRLNGRISNMRPVMTRIGAMYERRVLENFRAESAPDGTPWKPLSAVTMMLGLGRRRGFRRDGGLSARGRRYLSGKRILREHGDLEGSIHSQASRHSVTIGAGGHIPYAAIHQFGGQAGRGRRVTIPARPYLALNRATGLELAEDDRQMVIGLIRDGLLGN